MNLSMKQKQTLRQREQTCGRQRGGVGGEGRCSGLAVANYTRRMKQHKAPTALSILG